MGLPRSPQAAPTTPPLARAFIILILAHLVVAQSVFLFPRLLAVDFYHYWGVATALALRGETLGTPYRNPREYAAAMSEFASRPGDERLTAVGRILTQPGFTATPFFYWLFGAFPRDYTVALAIHHIVQLIFFLAAVIIIGRVYRYALFPLLCLALVLVLGSGPLSSDLRVGNVGSLQLAAVAVLVAGVHRLRHSLRPLALGAIILTGLTILTLAKPNVALITAAMALHLWLTQGIRFVATAAVPAALAGAAVLIIPSLYFGSWTVWLAWYQVVFGGNPYGLARAPGPGNYSTTKMFAAWLHLPMGTVVLLVATVLAVSLLAVAIASQTADVHARARPTVRVLGRVLGDPDRAVAIAVTVTVALSPLFWYHYFLIVLIPGLWLLNTSTGSRYVSFLGLASLVLSSGLLNVLFIPLNWTDAVGVGAVLTWLPLWAGILLTLYLAPAHEAAGPAGPPAAKRDERRTEAHRPAQGPRGPKTAARA